MADEKDDRILDSGTANYLLASGHFLEGISKLAFRKLEVVHTQMETADEAKFKILQGKAQELKFWKDIISRCREAAKATETEKSS